MASDEDTQRENALRAGVELDERCGRAAYEAYCAQVDGMSPMNGPWDGMAEWNKRAWIAAGIAAAAAGARGDGSC